MLGKLRTLALGLSRKLEGDTADTEDRGISPSHIPCVVVLPPFFDVFEVILDYLRGLYIAAIRDEYELVWPNDLRLQSHHDRYSRKFCPNIPNLPIDADARLEALSMLQTLNSLNKFSNSYTRRVLGYSLIFRLPYSPKQLEPRMSDLRSGLFGDYTRELNFIDVCDRESVSGSLMNHHERFLQALTSTPSSMPQDIGSAINVTKDDGGRARL